MKSKKPNQKQRFIETARELGCDEDGAKFNETMKKMAPAQKQGRTSSASQARQK